MRKLLAGVGLSFALAAAACNQPAATPPWGSGGQPVDSLPQHAGDGPPVADAADDGMPFGPVGDADVERLAQFAKTSGFDLTPEMKRVYEKDEDALARLFKLSLAFKTLDANARTYGQIIYSSVLNLGEVMGVEAYAKVLGRQPVDVQQRVRDFLYYPVLQVPKDKRGEAEAETRREYPTLFPAEYRLGKDDPLFAKET